MQPGVGHYGVFSGKRWEAQIYPLVKNVDPVERVERSAQRHTLPGGPPRHPVQPGGMSRLPEWNSR